MNKLDYFPCVMSESGRIDLQVGGPMSMAEATCFLMENFKNKWEMCEAIPQRVDHPYFRDVPRSNFSKLSHIHKVEVVKSKEFTRYLKDLRVHDSWRENITGIIFDGNKFWITCSPIPQQFNATYYPVYWCNFEYKYLKDRLKCRYAHFQKVIYIDRAESILSCPKCQSEGPEWKYFNFLEAGIDGIWAGDPDDLGCYECVQCKEKLRR